MIVAILGAKCAKIIDGDVGVLGELHILPVVILRLARIGTSLSPSSST